MGIFLVTFFLHPYLDRDTLIGDSAEMIDEMIDPLS